MSCLRATDGRMCFSGIRDLSPEEIKLARCDHWDKRSANCSNPAIQCSIWSALPSGQNSARMLCKDEALKIGMRPGFTGRGLFHVEHREGKNPWSDYCSTWNTHFPMQNSEKMSSRTASSTFSPNSSPQWERAACSSAATHSAISPSANILYESWQAEWTRSIRLACRCRIRPTPSTVRALGRNLVIAPFRSRRPVLSTAEIEIVRARSETVSGILCLHGMSILFLIIRKEPPPANVRSSSSPSLQGREESVTISTRSASLASWRVRLIPSTSTAPDAVRSPAVSLRRTKSPSHTTCPSITSRVVPGVWVTMARSSPRRALNRVDFPTLGRPMRATEKPCCRRRPPANVSSN